MSDSINKPAHYAAGKIECIDAIEAATTGLEGIEAVCTANIIKYVWRWKRKNGVEDLRKAEWYLHRLISENVSLSSTPSVYENYLREVQADIERKKVEQVEAAGAALAGRKAPESLSTLSSGVPGGCPHCEEDDLCGIFVEDDGEAD